MAIPVNQAIAPQKPVAYTAICVTADIAFHAPVNVVDLVPIADNTEGMRLTRVYAILRADLSANCNCLLFKKVGSTYTLINSVLLTDTTPTASVANNKARFDYDDADPLFLHPGEGLGVAIGLSLANGVVFRAEGGAYDADA